jgi:hypothetical protein
MRTRITVVVGDRAPDRQASMGFIARAQLAWPSPTGGLGIIGTSSGRLDEVRAEIAKMPRPHRQAIRREHRAAVRATGHRRLRRRARSFVTTSAGDPTKFTSALKDAGITVFHVVPSLRGALKAVGAGVDGLVVEGNEGGGFKAPTGASTMVLLPLITSEVDGPVIAAGGICDGRSMAASLPSAVVMRSFAPYAGVPGAEPRLPGECRRARDPGVSDRPGLREPGAAPTLARAVWRRGDLGGAPPDPDGTAPTPALPSDDPSR